jgi:5'-3' exonuclease
MRARYARGTDRRPAQNDSRCGWDTRKVRRQPALIPDLLALVGDAADGYPGIPGIGAKTAAQLLNRYGQIEKFPSNVLGEQRDLALLFKKLATLRTDAPLFRKVETLRWRGPTPEFAAWADRMEAPRLLERCDRVKLRHAVLRQ